MRLALRKIIRQIKRQEFGKTRQVPLCCNDPQYRRAAHAPMCIR